MVKLSLFIMKGQKDGDVLNVSPKQLRKDEIK